MHLLYKPALEVYFALQFDLYVFIFLKYNTGPLLQALSVIAFFIDFKGTIFMMLFWDFFFKFSIFLYIEDYNL